MLGSGRRESTTAAVDGRCVFEAYDGFEPAVLQGCYGWWEMKRLRTSLSMAWRKMGILSSCDRGRWELGPALTHSSHLIE